MIKKVVFLIVLVALLFGSAHVLAMPTPTGQAQTPSDEIIPPTSTPLPPELLQNMYQTTGILIGGVILILIVIAGTLGTIRRSRR